MNRSWITALTLAAVAGSGAAFTGVIVNSDDRPAVAAEPMLVNRAAPASVELQATATRTTTYEVGIAGAATLTSGNGTLTIDNAAAGTGWAVTGTSGSGTHVEAQFTDGTQRVTFGADLVGNEVVVSLTNESSAPATTAAPAEVVQVAVIDTTEPTLSTPTPEPATPRPAARPAVVWPSGGDDAGGDDHQTEPNDD